MAKFKIGDRVHYDDRLTKGVGTIHLRAPENEGFDWGVAVAEHDRKRGYHKGNIRWFLARDLRLALTIEPGRHYRTRSGKPTGRVSKGDTGFEAVVDGRVRIFDKAGGAVHGDDDIVEAWVPKVGERVRFKLSYGTKVAGEAAIVVAVPPTSWAFRVRLERDGDESTEILSDLEPLPVAAPQPAAPTLKIEAGRYYKTRDGRKVGPIRDTGGTQDHWTADETDIDLPHWHDDGAHWKGRESSTDLTAEWPTAQSNVSAQVDAINEEYGPARVATTSDDDDIVEMSIGELTMAIADALRVVGKKTAKKPVKIGDAVTLSAPARIAGIDKKNAMVVLETGGSFALPLAALRAA